MAKYARGLDGGVARKFSFEYGSEVLEVKTAEVESNVDAIAGDFGEVALPFVDVDLNTPPRPYTPAQTFGEMLGLQRVPTALME
jgi:hypothetical protein